MGVLPVSSSYRIHAQRVDVGSSIDGSGDVTQGIDRALRLYERCFERPPQRDLDLLHVKPSSPILRCRQPRKPDVRNCRYSVLAV
jgi:hypothetical protein